MRIWKSSSNPGGYAACACCRESNSGSLAFNRDQCNVPCGFDELNLGVRRYPRFGGVEGKGTKHLAILRQNRLGPRCANPVPDGKVLKLIGPVYVRCNVRDDDPLFQERRSKLSWERRALG